MIPGFTPIQKVAVAEGRTLAAAGSMLAGVLANNAASSGLQSLVSSEGAGMAHTSNTRIAKLLEIVRKRYGVDVGYMHDPYIAGENAGFATPEMMNKNIAGINTALNDPATRDHSAPEYVHPSKRRAMISHVDELKKKMRNNGIIITGKHFKKPGTVEHELGHAIAANKGNFIEQATAKYNIPSYSTAYHTLPSYVAAFAGGGKSPLKGALAGGLAGLLTDVPTLYSEYSANKYGDKLMKPGSPQHAKTKAYGSYLSSSVLPFAVTGGLYGLAKRKWKL